MTSTQANPQARNLATAAFNAAISDCLPPEALRMLAAGIDSQQTRDLDASSTLAATIGLGDRQRDLLETLAWATQHLDSDRVNRSAWAPAEIRPPRLRPPRLRVRPRHAPPLTVEGEGPQQRAALENALVNALQAHTAEEFGIALKEVMQATGRTQGDIVRADSRTEKKWLSKSTVSRMVKGTTVPRNREQVEAFIRACGGVDTYVETWGFAWLQIRSEINRQVTTPDQETSVDAESVDEPSSDPRSTFQAQDPLASADTDRSSAQTCACSSSTKDDALLDVHVRVTKDHLMKAAPVLVAMGLLATGTGRMPSGRELVAMALLGAAGVALFSHMQQITQANDDAPHDAPPSGATSDTAKENPAVVYVTAPQKRGRHPDAAMTGPAALSVIGVAAAAFS